MNFRQLHQQDRPLLICNVWDAASAKVAQQLNFSAIGTSSAAIATMLGYADGEAISFEELLYIAERVAQATSLPLTVDLEAGYGRNPQEIVDNIQRLAQLGVVGINLEDSVVKEKRELVESDGFAKCLSSVSNQLIQQNVEMFLNVRTDTFLLGIPNPVAQTLERARLYQAAGADGLFVPCLEKPEEIEQIVQEINVPLNVMCMPQLPRFDRLQALGVKRISMGNVVFDKLNAMLENELQTILASHTFQPLFA